MKTPLYIGEQMPFGPRALFDCVLPARSWEMPVERELPAKIGRCYKKLAGHKELNKLGLSEWFLGLFFGDF